MKFRDLPTAGSRMENLALPQLSDLEIAYCWFEYGESSSAAANLGSLLNTLRAGLRTNMPAQRAFRLYNSDALCAGGFGTELCACSTVLRTRALPEGKTA